MPRKQLSKKEREEVYNKYNGHCAYCGCKLEYRDMQVDHIEPVFIAEYVNKEEINESMDNYNPACRACNFYKGIKSLDEFRSDIETKLIKKLKNDFNYKLLVKYGLIEENLGPVSFYFEKYDK